ncbi:uncharacterized protein C15orf39 homolog [Pelodytes ibericus]
MADKRQASECDNTTYSKLSRVQVEPERRSIGYPVEASREEMLSYKSFMTYAEPGLERHNAPAPWSAATAYLQYAGNALGQQLGTEEASVRCHRQDAERLRNHSQFHEISGNHLQVQQHHQVLSYPLPSPHGCPRLAVPRPVYRTPAAFVDTGYGAQGFSPLGIQMRAPPLLHAHAIEWNATQLAYSSPPIYPSGANKLCTTHIGTPERVRSPFSLTQGIQELSSAHRQRENASMPFTLPSSQEDHFIDHYASFAQPNASQLYPQGDVSVGRQKNSAFNPLIYTPNNYISSAFHGSMSNYSPAGVGYPHRSSSYHCSNDTTFSPYFARGPVAHTTGEITVNRPHINRDLSIGTTHTSKNLKLTESSTNREVQVATTQVNRDVKHSSTHAERNLQLDPVHVDRDLHVRSTQVQRNNWMTPPKEGIGRSRGSTQSSIEQQVTETNTDSLRQKIVQSSHLSPMLNHGHLDNSTPVKSSSSSQLHSSFNSHTTRDMKNASVCQKNDNVCVQKSVLNEESPRHTTSPPAISSVESQQYGTRDKQLRSQNLESVPLNPKIHSHLIPSVAETNLSRPPSPPMPVINDVFSLAPYQDYLDGTATHPFSLSIENGMKNTLLSSPFLQATLPESTKGLEKKSYEPPKMESTPVEKLLTPSKPTNDMQENDLKSVSFQNAQVEEMVLDLRLKKSPQLFTSPKNKEKAQAPTATRSPLQCSKGKPSQLTIDHPSNTPTHSNAPSCSQATTTTFSKTSAQTAANYLLHTTLACPSPTSIQTSTSHPSKTTMQCSPQYSSSCFPPSFFASPTKCITQSLIPPHTSTGYSIQLCPLVPLKSLSYCSTHLQPKYTESRRIRHPSDSSHFMSSVTEPDNDINGFHSSKSFMFKKYKIMKRSCPGGESPGTESRSASDALTSQCLLPSESMQSFPPSAPESSPTLGEANVSLASGEESVSGSGRHFNELHHSVLLAISNSIISSPPAHLQDWLSKSKEVERPKSPVKGKMSSRTVEPSPDREIWLAFDGVRMLVHNLLSQLETFMFTRKCPFPHVIRAGAIFIPIHLVKEVLFSELLGASVDRVLQRHKVELRPTTLSEEKLLRETELKGCPSRMLKLLALKQLPDVYPDLLHLYWGYCIQKQLGNGPLVSLREEECHTKGALKSFSSDGDHAKVKIPSSKKGETSLVLKLHRVSQGSGNHVYSAQKLRSPQDGGSDVKQKGDSCRKKGGVKQRARCPYRKRRRGLRRGLTKKKFPDLVGRRILHLFDDGKKDTWFRGKVLRIHRQSNNPRDTQYEVWYDDEPGTRYYLELQQDYEKGWLRLERPTAKENKVSNR